MKMILFVLVATWFAGHCSAQTGEKNCGDFKTGKFAYRDSANHVIEVTRKENRQQEYDKVARTITKFKIRWISNCEYELTQLWSNSKARRKNNRSINRIVITKANGDNSYEYNCGCPDREIKGSIGTMVRLGD